MQIVCTQSEINITRCIHFTVNDIGEDVPVREKTFHAISPGSEYKTNSSIADNLYFQPDVIDFYKSQYVSGEFGDVNTIGEKLTNEYGTVIIDVIDKGIQKVVYYSGDTTSVIYTVDNYKNEGSLIQSYEENFSRVFSIFIASNNFDPLSTNPYINGHLYNGHKHHVPTHVLFSRDNELVASRKLFESLSSTEDVQVNGTFLITNDLNKYYLGNRVEPNESPALLTSLVDEETGQNTFLDLGISFDDTPTLRSSMVRLLTSAEPPSTSESRIFKYSFNNKDRYYYFDQSKVDQEDLNYIKSVSPGNYKFNKFGELIVHKHQNEFPKLNA